MGVKQTGDFGADIQGFRHQEGLPGIQMLVHPFTIEPGLVQHPFVGGMLIHEHHPRRRLRHDVHLTDLTDHMQGRQVPDHRFRAARRPIGFDGGRHGQAAVRPQVEVNPGEVQGQAVRVWRSPLPPPFGVLMHRHDRQRRGLRHLLIRSQAVLHGMQHCRKQGPVPQTPYFRLAGVDIDIQQDRIHFKEDEAKGKSPAGQAPVTSLHDRLRHRPVLNPATVDKHVDMAPVGIVQRRRRDETRHPDIVAPPPPGAGPDAPAPGRAPPAGPPAHRRGRGSATTPDRCDCRQRQPPAKPAHTAASSGTRDRPRPSRTSETAGAPGALTNNCSTCRVVPCTAPAGAWSSTLPQANRRRLPVASRRWCDTTVTWLTAPMLNRASPLNPRV